MNKNSNQAQFLQSFFHFQEEIRSLSGKSGKQEILFGALKPEQEKLMHVSEDESLYLSASKDSEHTVSYNDKKEMSQGDIFHTITTYTKSSFEGKPTYKIKRVTTVSGTAIFTMFDYINWLGSFHEKIFHANFEEFLKESKIYEFLCDVHDCSLEKKDNSFIIKMRPNNKLKSIDEPHYSRLEKLLNTTEFEATSFFGNSQEPFLKITNAKDSVSFEFIRNETHHQKSSGMKLRIDGMANFYGLRMFIKGLEYRFQHQDNNYKVFIEKVPRHRISGRLLYFLPTSVINFFIPQDMDEYIRQYFTLQTKGNDGKGTFTENIILPQHDGKKKAKYVSESEVFQKPFRLFASSSSSDKKPGNFLPMLEKSIVEDLKE